MPILFSITPQPTGYDLQFRLPHLQSLAPTTWANLFWLIIIFGVMLLLNRWITRHVNGLGLLISMNQSVATWLYFFLFLPGILVHEVSHYLVALLLRADPSKLSLWPTSKRGRVVLGSVEIKKAHPLTHSIIGLAPLVVGCVVIWMIAQFLQFDRLGEAISSGDLNQTFRAIGFSVATPDFWLWLYLLFAVANAMLPSPADRVYWRPVLIFLGSLLLFLIGFGLFPEISPFFQDIFFNTIALLVFALSTVVVVDLLFIVIIFLLEVSLGAISGRRVQY